MTKTSDTKSQLLDGIEYQFSSDWIHHLESEQHWTLYWKQTNLVLKELQKGDTILEIGPGSGFLSNYLRSKGFHVTTLDIDEQKSPDILSNIVEYPFPDKYDHILAFEVFEHIPFDKFAEILPKLRKTARKNFFFSLPRNYKIWFSIDLIIPYFRNVSFTFKTKRHKITTRNHFWELDYKNYNLNNLDVTIKDVGFLVSTIRKESLAVFFQLKPDSQIT